MLIIGLSLFPKNQLHNISQVLIFLYFPRANWTMFFHHLKHGKKVLIIGLSLFPKSQLHSIFSIYNGNFFNIYGACRAIDVDTRREVVIKTWKTSAKNRSFSISKEPNKRNFFNIYGA